MEYPELEETQRIKENDPNELKKSKFHIPNIPAAISNPLLN